MRSVSAAWLLGFCMVAVLGAFSSAQSTWRLDGAVLDQGRATVAGAEITLHAKGYRAQRTSARDGSFFFPAIPAGPALLTVTAPGFATYSRRVEPSESPAEIVLAVARVEQELVVTPSRVAEPASEAAASVTRLDRRELQADAHQMLDDKLRQIAGFNLFRRQSSRAANPTTEGVSLRGLGSNGASRTLVLSDGVPLNDPFGGWVYWNRVPSAAIDSVEVMRGGGSHLYGSAAMGGVIDIATEQSAGDSFQFTSSYGADATPYGSLLAAKTLGKVIATLSAEAARSNGYFVVGDQDRGRIDTPASVRYSVADLRLERTASAAGRSFLRTSFFDEGRANGTVLQNNGTRLAEASGGLDRQSAIGIFNFRLYGSAQTLRQTFSAISSDRNQEFLTDIQRVPAQQIGTSLTWSKDVNSRQALVAGLEFRQVHGITDELFFSRGSPTQQTAAGGDQRTAAFFGQDSFSFKQRVRVTVGARLDRWSDVNAASVTVPVAASGSQRVTPFNDRVQSAASPHVAVLIHATSRFALAASAYGAFRAPTLNELYRSFRVGNVLTLANSDLKPERLWGGESGGTYSFRNVRLRAGVFWADVHDPVANLTLASTPDLISRQRANLGVTRSRGVEAEGEWHLTTRLSIDSSYQFAQATVVKFAADPRLVGLWVPQVPRHQFAISSRYTSAKWMMAVQGRAIGRQFDDDQNRLPLAAFFSLDAIASRELNRNVSFFLAAENLTSQRYMVSRTPIPTLGPPLQARAGLRLRWPTR